MPAVEFSIRDFLTVILFGEGNPNALLARKDWSNADHFMKSFTIVFTDGSLPDHVKATSVQFEGNFAVFYVEDKFLVAYPASRIKEVK